MVRAFVHCGSTRFAHESLQIFLEFRVPLHSGFVLLKALIIKVRVLLTTVVFRLDFRDIVRSLSFSRGLFSMELSIVSLETTSLTISLNSGFSKEGVLGFFVSTRLSVKGRACVSFFVCHNGDLRTIVG